MTWNRRDLRFRIHEWANILFTDESRFHLDSGDGRSREYRRVGELYADACVIQRQSFGGDSVIVWGGITAHGRTPLVVVAGILTGLRYRDEIVQPYVIPFIQSQANNVTFQQDNARPHVARVVRDYLTQQNVDLLPWPAVSPNISPIEHVWDEMERRLRHLSNQPVTLAEMVPALIRIWNNIPQAFFNNLVRSMRCRCQACINANGGHKRY
jgi:hypothetical protein